MGEKKGQTRRRRLTRDGESGIESSIVEWPCSAATKTARYSNDRTQLQSSLPATASAKPKKGGFCCTASPSAPRLLISPAEARRGADLLHTTLVGTSARGSRGGLGLLCKSDTIARNEHNEHSRAARRAKESRAIFGEETTRVGDIAFRGSFPFAWCHLETMLYVYLHVSLCVFERSPTAHMQHHVACLPSLAYDLPWCFFFYLHSLLSYGAPKTALSTRLHPLRLPQRTRLGTSHGVGRGKEKEGESEGEGECGEGEWTREKEAGNRMNYYSSWSLCLKPDLTLTQTAKPS